jgi:hypothetical protein
MKANRKLRSYVPDERNFKEEFRKNFQEICTANNALQQELRSIRNPIAARVSAAISARLDIEPGSPAVLEPGVGYPVNPEANALFRRLVFLKYGITFRELIRCVEENPRVFYAKLIRVHRDFGQLLSGQRLLKDLQLTFNYDHFEIIVQGLDFGLDELNEWALADCLDEICPCCQLHSPEYMRKCRTQFLKACLTLIELSPVA